MSLQRRLAALGHPSTDSFSPGDDNQLRNAIIWIEEQKIRHWSSEERDILRQTQLPNWQLEYQRYLTSLNAPFPANEVLKSLLWLAGVAINSNYETLHHSNLNQNGLSDGCESGQQSPSFDALDFMSDAFKLRVNEFADKCQIPNHPKHLLRLKAVALLISNALNKQDELHDHSRQTKKIAPCGRVGLDAGDSTTLDKVSLLLRLTYVSDLRQLQTQINEIIARVQSITANPKTDIDQGKVGH